MCPGGSTSAPAHNATASPSPPSTSLKPSSSNTSLASSSSASSFSTISSTFSDRDTTWYHNVVLGFAEPASGPSAFRPGRFPCKLGGLPVWVYGTPADALRCLRCDAVLAFLLQLYAPLPDVDDAFHRVLYLFVCRKRGCAGGKGSARVIVGQMPRRNSLYPFEADDDFGEGGVGNEVNTSCVLCGFAATARCGKCQREWYCSRDCQRTDWGLCHRALCHGRDGRDVESVIEEEESNPGSASEVQRRKVAEGKRASWRFKEFEIVNEECPTPGGGASESEDADKNGDDVSKERQVSKGSFQEAGKNELPASLFKARRGRKRNDDSVFRRFSDYMRDAPTQIVRYWRGGRVLWPARGGRPGSVGTATGEVCGSDRSGENDWNDGNDVKNGGAKSCQVCQRCEGPMVFEAQAVPQILFYIGVDRLKNLKSNDGGCGGLDFGTIAMFTCKVSCGFGGRGYPPFSYVEEVAYVQAIENSGPGLAGNGEASTEAV